MPGEDPVKDEFFAENGLPIEESDVVEVESSTELSRLHHACMEPHACIADYDPYERSLTLYSPNQAVFGVRTVVADYLELPYHKVRVVKTTMGGSFGAKQEWILEPTVALLAQMLARPIKLVLTRSQTMVSTIVRAPMRATLKGKFAHDGRILKLDMDVLSDAGAYIGNSSDYIRTLYGKLFRCYNIPYVRYHARVISSNTPVSGAYRGWSAPEEALMMEHLLENASRQLEIDPIELRLKNVLLPGQIDLKSGLPIEDIRIQEALLYGHKRFQWEKKKHDDELFNTSQSRLRRGVGVGCGGHGNTYYPRLGDFARAELRLNEDGTLRANLCLHDHGCGTVTAFRMIIAEALGIDPEHIQISEADSSVSPFDFGCFASRSTFVIGRATYDAAQKLSKQILAAASALYALPQKELYLENSGVRSYRDTSFFHTFGEISLGSILQLGQELAITVNYQETSNPGVTGAHFVHVEVDTDTGFVKILEYLAIHDIGQPINPAMCKAQIQGAVQMGCGAALREKLTIQPNGRCTDSLSKYHLFLANDLPDIQVELITDGLSHEGPYGAKSIGEVAFVPSAPALCSAINRALNADLGTLPFDPDCILKYLAKEKQV